MGELEDLRAALTAVELGVWWWDIESDTIRWSDEMSRLFGRDAGAAPPSYEDYLAMVPLEERGPLHAAISDAIRSAADGKASTRYAVEHRVVLADDTVRWIEGQGQVIVDGDGHPVRLTGTAVDVTARKQLVEQLRRREEIYRIFSELASDYVYVADLLNPRLFPEIVGGSFERTTGLTPSEIEAKGGWWGVVHPDDHVALASLLPRLMEGQPSVNEYRITDGRGQIRWLRDSVHPVADPGTGKVVKLMGGVQDITDRKRLEHQLLQAQKLEAVGRVSGGIAHDFNNLLSVILASVGLLARETTTDAARECCEAIQESVARGVELTRSLLVFARRDAGTPELVNLTEVVRQAVPMLARAVGSGIAVHLDGQHVAAPVRIDPGQVQLLLLNLAVNARDAMPDGGAIRIVIESRTYEGHDELPSELAPGSYVRLSVADQGEGIQPELMSRVFEPFFTTKPQGKGTGLGLAACQGIVAQAGGSIVLTSVVGQGTTFVIYLPRLSGQAVPYVVGGVHHSPGGTERILLVEDEPLLRGVLVRSLQDFGYTVLSAHSAEDALTILASEAVALLITDIVLPGLRGTELARQAMASRPDLRVLLMSGYPGDTPLPASIRFLAKPFSMERLAHSVRAVLDAPSTGGAPGPIGG